MVHIRKFALLATLAAFASAPTAAMAAGPTSLTTDCFTAAQISLSPGQTFLLTDVTIGNKSGGTVSVGITNTFTVGVQYVVGDGTTVTQKFETPIKFVAAHPPFISCSSASGSVFVSIQGVIPTQQ